jgi:hypothetical protein
MRNIKQFSLIGEPATKEHIQWMISRSPSGGFASGDFSAATDNVKIQLTKLCFEKILLRLCAQNNVSGDEISTYREVLYEHMIHYPTDYGEVSLEPVLQKNGQLMGSVLSFFILCLINFCTYWHAVEPQVTRYQDLTVLINGDDILFRCTPQQYNNWLNNLPYAGLTPSPGKNFYSESYCTVNSLLFHVNDDRKEVTYIPFYNVGMLIGQSKVAKVSDTGYKPIQYLFPEILEGSLNPLDSLKRYLYYNKKVLKECAVSDDGYALNYMLPRELGGIGINCPGVKYITTDEWKSMSKDDCTDSFYCIVNRRQMQFALHAHKYWTSPYVKPLFKPAGEAIDITARSFYKDHPDMDYKIRLHADCPQLPEVRELITRVHRPNWNSSTLSSGEEEDVTYRHHKIYLNRKYQDKSSLPLELISNLRLKPYKYHGFAPISA